MLQQRRTLAAITTSRYFRPYFTTLQSRLQCLIPGRCYPKRRSISTVMPHRHGKSGGSSSSGKAGATAPVSLSDLQKKPCLLCGREITPRAAFARNWDEIKYCSDSCRRQKKLNSTVSLPIASSIINHLQICKGQVASSAQDPRETILWAFSTASTADGSSVKVNIEDWVESAILHVAGRHSAKGRPTCEDVEEALKIEARHANEHIRPQGESSGSEMTESERQSSAADGPNLSDALLSALDAAPGLRERVRRAARRLLILSPEQSQDGSHRRKLRLRQGKRDLVTLEDVSYAKGSIELYLEK